MDDDFLSERRRVLLILASAGLLIVLMIAGLSLFRRTPSQEALPPAVKMDYCGAEPQGVCIFSFGRDGDGNTVINLFVSGQEAVSYELQVSRATGEGVYACSYLKEFPSNVYCTGPALNLNEPVRITLRSSGEGRILAAGNFIVKAILLVSGTPQFVEAGSTLSATPITEAAPVTETPSVLPTIQFSDTNTPAPSAEVTEDPSYPSYP